MSQSCPWSVPSYSYSWSVDPQSVTGELLGSNSNSKRYTSRSVREAATVSEQVQLHGVGAVPNPGCHGGRSFSAFACLDKLPPGPTQLHWFTILSQWIIHDVLHLIAMLFVNFGEATHLCSSMVALPWGILRRSGPWTQYILVEPVHLLSESAFFHFYLATFAMLKNA